MRRTGLLLIVAARCCWCCGLLLALLAGAASDAVLSGGLAVLVGAAGGRAAGRHVAGSGRSGQPDFGLEPALRRLLWLTPLAAVLMIPVLVRPGAAVRLGRWPRVQHAVRTELDEHIGPRDPQRRLLRAVDRAGAAVRPAPARSIRWSAGAASPPFGLFVYLVTATLASVDWAMTTEPDWFSAEFGSAVHRHTGDHRDQRRAAAGGPGMAAGSSGSRRGVPAAGRCRAGCSCSSCSFW